MDDNQWMNTALSYTGAWKINPQTIAVNKTYVDITGRRFVVLNINADGSVDFLDTVSGAKSTQPEKEISYLLMVDEEELYGKKKGV